MNDVTRTLRQIEAGDPSAAEALLPLVYDELRRLAAQRLARESPDQTLHPTALVHEAYVRLVESSADERWNSRGHFFAAAGEAMRRILVETARRKQRLRHGGERQRLELTDQTVAGECEDDLVLSIDESLAALAEQNTQAAELVKLRFFAGLPLSEAAAALDISPRTADRLWAYAKAWLHRQLRP